MKGWVGSKKPEQYRKQQQNRYKQENTTKTNQLLNERFISI
jgi:hypothetical protein